MRQPSWMDDVFMKRTVPVLRELSNQLEQPANLAATKFGERLKALLREGVSPIAESQNIDVRTVLRGPDRIDQAIDGWVRIVCMREEILGRTFPILTFLIQQSWGAEPFYEEPHEQELIELAKKGDRTKFDEMASCYVTKDRIQGLWEGLRTRLRLENSV